MHLEGLDQGNAKIPEMYIHRLHIALQEIKAIPSFARIVRAVREGGKHLNPFSLRAAFIAADSAVAKSAVSSLATAFGLDKKQANQQNNSEAKIDGNLALTLGLTRAAFKKAFRTLIESLQIGSGHGALFDDDLVDFFGRDGQGERYDWGDFKWALEAALFGINSTFVVDLKGPVQAPTSGSDGKDSDVGDEAESQVGAEVPTQSYGHAIAMVYPSVHYVHLDSFIRYLARMKLQRKLHWEDWCNQKEVCRLISVGGEC